MLLEYAQRFYPPALASEQAFSAKGGALLPGNGGVSVARLRKSWDVLSVQGLSSPSEPILTVGQRVSLKALVCLGDLSPQDVAVELYYGPLSSEGEIEDPRRLEMTSCGTEDKAAVYCTEATCDRTGRQGYTVRVLPKHPALVHPFLPGFVKWG